VADLNTRSKRASSIRLWMPFVLAPPLPDGTLGQGDRQHIAWTYSGILAAAAAAGLGYSMDMNTRIWRYLLNHYAVSTGDLTSLSRRYVDGLTTGDATARWRQLEDDATGAM